MSKVALINPDYYDQIFSGSKVRAAITRGTTPLGLASLAGSLLDDGHQVEIWDLNLMDEPVEYLKAKLAEFRPDTVGFSSTTPLISKVYAYTDIIKKFDPSVVVIAGGPHPSAVPDDVLAESQVDCVIKGEGEFVINDIANRKPFKSIPNLVYKEGGHIRLSDNQGWGIKDVDQLPLPAYQLFDIKQYRQTKISSRRAPLGYLETSRGCYAKCVFCNKNIHGFKMRMKSPERVVQEIKRMLAMGFEEIHIIDDIFTADMKRAYEICELIIKSGLKFPWYPRGGIRVDRVNPDLLRIMRKAGCYRIPFGVESGSQRIMDVVQKRITREQALNAVAMAKQAGLETECYFMLGLPTETEADIQSSIDFAIRLDPDYAKFAVTIPLPGTQMFDEMSVQGRIKTRDWSKYHFATTPKEIYDHDTLSWGIIEKYYDLSHRMFYFRPSYITKRAWRSLVNGTLFGHIQGFLRTSW